MWSEWWIYRSIKGEISYMQCAMEDESPGEGRGGREGTEVVRE